MSYPKNMVQLKPNKGVNVDVPPSEIGPEFFTQANNAVFRNGIAQRVLGEVPRYAGVLSNMRNIINVQDSAGINYWVYTGEDSINVAAPGPVHSDITPVGGLTSRDDPNTYTTSLLNGLLVWNNGDDAPQVWDGVPANPMTEIPGWIAGDRCESMRPFKFHLFALDMTESVAGSLPSKLKWSSAAAPGAIPQSWTPAADNDAGDNQLADTPGRIIDAAPLRSDFILYKTNSTYLCSFVGGQNVFSFRKLFVTSGVLSRNCITEYNGSHYVLTADDIIRHDGNHIESLLDKRARNAIFGNLDEANFQSSFVVNYEKKKELWFCLPSAGNFFADVAVIYNLTEDAWSTRDLVEVAHAAVGRVNDTTVITSWDSDSEAWDDDLTSWNQQEGGESQLSLVLASTDETVATDSNILEADIGSNFNGVPINGLLQKVDMTFDEPERIKIIKRVHPKIQGNTGTTLSIRIGSTSTPGGAIIWSAPVTFTVGTDEFVDMFAQGKFLAFEISGAGNTPWFLNSFAFEMEIRGYH